MFNPILKHEALHVEGVQGVSETRVRWIGHRLHAELNIAVKPQLSVGEGHAIAKKVNHELLHHLPNLSFASIHVDPLNVSGEKYHHDHHDLGLSSDVL